MTPHQSGNPPPLRPLLNFFFSFQRTDQLQTEWLSFCFATGALRTSREGSMKKKLVVVGNGMAGMRAVEELLKIAPELYDITVFGAEPYGNYNRIMLSPVLCGEKSVPEIMINDTDWYQTHQIHLHAGKDKKVIQIDRCRKTVQAADGTTAAYDRLLLATGSLPHLLPVPGKDLAGVIAFRTIEDVET